MAIPDPRLVSTARHREILGTEFLQRLGTELLEQLLGIGPGHPDAGEQRHDDVAVGQPLLGHRVGVSRQRLAIVVELLCSLEHIARTGESGVTLN